MPPRGKIGKVSKKEMKVRVPKGAGLAQFFLRPSGGLLLAGFAFFSILGLGAFTYYYSKYSRLIDEKLRVGPFANTAKLYAAPQSVAVGDMMTPAEVAAELRRSGYNESRSNPIGYYLIQPNAIEVFPGPESYFDQEAGVIRFSGDRISQIVSLQDNTSRGMYQLEPQLITNLSGPNREKRRIVRFDDIPKVVVDAITSAEDKRFFQHSGFDPIRILKAAYVDVKQGRKEQGASTLSQQLARGFWLDQDKRWTRKLAEVVITLQLEQKLSKEEIFEDYANQVYLGWRGSFEIHGFGEASEAYFGKDLSQINLPEAATLAGMIQRPSYFNPYKYQERTRERRNVILLLMRQNDLITERDYQLAIASPLLVAKTGSQSVDAPYFVDLVDDALQTKFQDANFRTSGFRIYTTLDMNLQRAAVEAVRLGMQSVDEQIKKQRRFRGQVVPEAQVALVAIDPHTAQVKAVVGGRNYGVSQLNHAVAKRQPGSIFKPFVYAAAMDTAVQGGPHILTASSTVLDEPTTFWFDGKPYEPSNFKHEFHGMVTLREALAHSMNVATVKVAQTVGYDAVVDMANRAGMNYKIQPTPAVALGAYEITPIEAAGAYTIFSNHGDYVKPSFLSMVRAQDGKVLYKDRIQDKQVLDPRVSYLMTNLMEEVLRTGTAAAVRARGFTVPAAGKTGTSHDGWFAGYTSELLCVVWVGFDDNRELDLEGAHSAAPIWGEFMKRALQFREYRNAREFTAPDGIVSIEIDSQSGMPATPYCPRTRQEVYIAGTQPVGTCPLHGGGRQGITNVAGWETPSPAAKPQPGDGSGLRITGAAGDGQVAGPAVVAQRAPLPTGKPGAVEQPPEQSPEQPGQKPKKGLFRRLWGVFK
ncbi:MAG: penicillin-binding protein 1A [Terriglobia bacterium]|nr:MAG: penicillin-binding protein 1A [Terriglobia bacterium]